MDTKHTQNSVVNTSDERGRTSHSRQCVCVSMCIPRMNAACPNKTMIGSHPHNRTRQQQRCQQHLQQPETRWMQPSQGQSQSQTTTQTSRICKETTVKTRAERQQHLHRTNHNNNHPRRDVMLTGDRDWQRQEPEGRATTYDKTIQAQLQHLNNQTAWTPGCQGDKDQQPPDP